LPPSSEFRRRSSKGNGAAARRGFLGSILIPADETVLCLCEGEQEEIEAVSAAAELPFERILGSRA